MYITVEPLYCTPETNTVCQLYFNKKIIWGKKFMSSKATKSLGITLTDMCKSSTIKKK